MAIETPEKSKPAKSYQNILKFTNTNNKPFKSVSKFKKLLRH
jgi:hypothetical protein